MLKAYGRYFDFAGRSRRGEFWLFYLWMLLVGVGLAMGNKVVLDATGSQMLNLAFGLFYVVFMLGSLIPLVAVVVRRLHDSDRSAKSLLTVLIPLVGPFVLLYFLIQAGTPGTNTYGPAEGFTEAPP